MKFYLFRISNFSIQKFIRKLRITFILICLLTSGGFASQVSSGVAEYSINIKKETIAEVSTQQQGKKVTGKVTDQTGASLPGVSVLVKGTTTGIVTDANGNFSLSNIPENATLQFSFVGMITQEIPTNGRILIDIVLKEEAIGLEEVVVVGYGTMKKSDLTGSVTRADLGTFRETANISLLQSMQGSVPGLNIGMVDEAGESPSLSIRGETTISGNKTVLIVMDGIIYQGGFSDINPNDVESVDILKDASSKAIYGAQAANGVMIITTKQGKGLKAGKPVMTFSTSYSTVSPTIRPRHLNRDEELKKTRDIFWKTAYTEASGYTEVNPNVDVKDLFTEDLLRIGVDRGYDTDWFDLATNKGYIQKYSLDVKGITGKSSYFISGGYDKQKNWIINDHFNRKSVRININTGITDWLTIGAQTFGSFSDYSGDSPSLNDLYIAGPLRYPYDENGELYYSFTSFVNPLIPTLRNDYDKRNTIFGNFYGELNIPFIPGLKYRINYGNQYVWNKKYYSDKYARSVSGEAKKINEATYDYTIDNIINYDKTLNKIHEFSVTLVSGIEGRSYESTSADAYPFTNLTLGYNSLQQGAQQFVSSDSWEQASSYQMGRLNYTFDKKYLFTANIRRDGFSGFAENEKIAYFPSIALGWVVSREKFMNNIDWLKNLKIRASWGKNGNLVSRYSSLASVSSIAAYVFGDGGSTQYGHAPTTLASPNLKWEKTAGLNLGLDFAIMGGKINGSLDYYNTVTKDLLWARTLPTMSGYSSILGNIGELKNTGFEMSLNAIPIRTNDFKWDFTFNFSTNINTVIHLLGDRDGDGIEDDLISSGLFIGQSLKSIYTYEIGGIYQIKDNIPAGYMPGCYIVKDNNNDGLFTADDRKIIGKAEPAYRFSVQNVFSYKNFTLKVFINSIQGGKMGYLAENEPDESELLNVVKNSLSEGIDYWTPANTDAEYMLPGALGAIRPTHYEDRSFVRLQDISLVYNLDKSIISKLRIGGLKLFVAGTNLFTWTKWKGLDPETAQGIFIGSRPVMRNYTLGLDITF